MKKGVNSVISITLVILITIVVAGVFFFWITTLQANSQGTTYLAQRNLIRNVLSEADELVDAFYTTVEEDDILAFSDFDTTICNTGDTILDLTAQKSIQVTRGGSGEIICAESVLDTSCLDSDDLIVVGLADAGSTASATPAAIVYSDDGGDTWNEAVGDDTSEDVNALAQLSVSTVTGESPQAFWSVSDDATTGNLAWAEDINGPWIFEDTGTREAYSSSIDSTNNILYIGADDFAGTGAAILRLTTADSEGTVDVQISTLQDTASDSDLSSGSATDYDGIFALYTSADVGGGFGLYLAGTGILGASDGVSGSLGNILFSTSSDFSSIAEATAPDSYGSINDFAETSGRIYASTSYDAAPALIGTTTSDVIYEVKTDIPPFLGTGWASTGFGDPGGTPQVSDSAEIRAIIDDPSASGNELYAAYTLTTGDSELRHYDPTMPSGSEWGAVLFTWTSSTVYDLAIDTTNQRFYAAVGNDAGGSEAAEIWRSGANYDDDAWTRVYSNTDRGAATSISIVSKCNKHNPTCIGCSAELDPGDCQDIQLVFEDSNCDLSDFSSESEFEIIFTIGRYFTKVFNFKKQQDPADQTLSSGNYNAATVPPVSLSSTPFLNATNRTNDTTQNLTVYAIAYSPAGKNATLIFDWKLNRTAGAPGAPESIALANYAFDTERPNASTGIKDYSSFQVSLQNNNATWNNASQCIQGGCYNFNGVNDWLEGVTHITHNLTNFTFTAWFRSTSNSSNRVVAFIGNTTATANTNRRTMLYLSAGAVTCQFNRLINGFPATVGVAGARGDDQWHFASCGRSAATLSVCVDGSCNTGGVGNFQMNHTEDILSVGRFYSRTAGWTGYFNGRIDEVKIYNYSLSTAQLDAIYNAGVPRYNTTHRNQTTVGDNWTVSVTPNDLSGDGSTVDTNSIIITNCVPTPACAGSCGGALGYFDGLSCYTDPSCTNVCGGGGGG